VIVADTSGLVAYFNDRDPAHLAVAAVVSEQSHAIVVSPFVLAELDYLITREMGHKAARIVLEELVGGAYALYPLDLQDLRLIASTLDRYPGRGLGLTDASLVVLAERVGATAILTLDQRDFAGLQRADGVHLTILPH
jgi:uncharacterized protein